MSAKVGLGQAQIFSRPRVYNNNKVRGLVSENVFGATKESLNCAKSLTRVRWLQHSW